MKRILLFLLATPVFAVEPLSPQDLENQAISGPAGTSAAAGEMVRDKPAPGSEGETATQSAEDSFAEVMAEASDILRRRSGLKYDLSVTGVHYAGSSDDRVYENGAFQVDVPERIDQVSLENIRVRGSDRPAMGNVFMQNIEVNNSEMVVTPR